MVATRILESTIALDLLDQIFNKLLASHGADQDIPILVSVDTETSKERLVEIGISTFDPHCLLIPTDNELDSLNCRITTYCYAKAGSKDRHRYKPYRLGIAHRFRNEDVPQILNTHLTPRNAQGNIRKIILVGQGITCDLRTLERCSGADISRISNIEASLDTSYIGQLILATPQRPSLKEMLNVLNLEFTGLHNAAHDSRYTLRALLMLYTRFKQQSNEVNGKALSNLILDIQEISRCHKIREGRKWTPTTRIKTTSSVPDLFRQDPDDDDNTEGIGIAALFV